MDRGSRQERSPETGHGRCCTRRRCLATAEAMTGRASPAKAAVGDKPVFEYIASLPHPQRGITEAVDALAAKPRRFVKSGMAYYGVGDGGFGCGGFVGHVKLMFVDGAALEPLPSVTPIGMGKSTGVWSSSMWTTSTNARSPHG